MPDYMCVFVTAIRCLQQEVGIMQTTQQKALYTTQGSRCKPATIA